MTDPYIQETNRLSTGSDRFFGIATALAIKAPVLVYAFNNLTLYGEQTIDTIDIVRFDRVLVGGQTDPIDNGIYECSDREWKRTGDFEGNRNVVAGTVILVNKPGLPVVQYYTVSAVEKVQVGVDPITFAILPVGEDTDDATEESYGLPLPNTSELQAEIEALQLQLSTLPNTSGLEAAIEALQLELQALPNTSEIEANIEALQLEVLGVSTVDSDVQDGLDMLQMEQADVRLIPDDLNLPHAETQCEQASNDGQEGSGGKPSGHIPAASIPDPKWSAIGINTWAQPSSTRGMIYHNDAIGSTVVRSDAGTEHELGKMVAYRCFQATGVTITKGSIVSVAGGFGGIVGIKLASAATDSGGTQTLAFTRVLGMVQEDIPDRALGYIVAFGEVRGFDNQTDPSGTTTKTDQYIYLSETPGEWTATAPQRRVVIGAIGYRDTAANGGSFAINVKDYDFSTFTGCSFQITGGGVATDPDIVKEFNVESIVHNGSAGEYLVTLNWFTMDWAGVSPANPGSNILPEIIENWTCKDRVLSPAEDRRAYITTYDTATYPTWFEFTYFVPTVNGTAVELIPTDMATDDELTFFGQMLPFAPPSG